MFVPIDAKKQKLVDIGMRQAVDAVSKTLAPLFLMQCTYDLITDIFGFSLDTRRLDANAQIFPHLIIPALLSLPIYFGAIKLRRENPVVLNKPAGG